MKNLFKFLLCAGLALLTSPGFSQNYNLQYRSSMTFPGQTLANICGYTQNGREYALLGASNGMIVVDITNPDAPQQIVQLPAPEGSPNNSSLWKEIKVFQHYAYVATEAGGGIQVVDLSPLPNATLPHHNYTGDGVVANSINTIHALHIDQTKGFLYLYGGPNQLYNGGATVYNLNQDPYNPKFVGKFDQLGYIHDGYVDNDTLYAGHIYAGLLSIVDMTNKANPMVLGTVQTPAKFTHNTWLLDDHKHILTTDEEVASFLTSFDITNPEDIQELDRISTTRDGQSSIGHNTHVRNDWAITSWYTDGVTIVDAHRPDNLVEVARYDTWLPAVANGDLFEGCWGAFPFFPSGTIVTSDIEPGVLTVLSPTYVRACYLEGTVYNGCNNSPMSGATIAVNTAEVRVNTTTKVNGVFKTGQVTPGNYIATISKPGFVTQNIPFTFTTGQVTNLNITLVPDAVFNLNGTVVDAETQAPIPNAIVTVVSTAQSFNIQTNNNGQFNLDCIAQGTYQITSGAWGYLPKTITINGTTPVNLPLVRGYYDDFQLDLGWEKTATSPTGHWEFGKPLGATLQNQLTNPNVDASVDNNDQCYATGNGSDQASVDDIDNGSSTLTSPSMNLANLESAKLSFYYWFYNGGGQGTPPNDNFVVNALSNGQRVQVFAQTVSASSWRFSDEINLQDFIPLSNDMRIEFVARDTNPGHLVEGGLDVFKVELGAATGVSQLDASAWVSASPNPSNGNFNIQFAWENATDAPVLEIRNMLGQVVLTEQLQAKTGATVCGGNWTPGVYFATLRSGQQHGVPVKLVKS